MIGSIRFPWERTCRPEKAQGRRLEAHGLGTRLPSICQGQPIITQRRIQLPKSPNQPRLLSPSM